jgi:hypothetical protein
MPIGIALDHAVLHLDGTANGIDHTSELNEDAIAHPLNDAAMMHCDGGIDQIAAERAQPGKRPVLVGTRKLAVPGYVRRENCREFPHLRHDTTMDASQSSTISLATTQTIALPAGRPGTRKRPRG